MLFNVVAVIVAIAPTPTADALLLVDATAITTGRPKQPIHFHAQLVMSVS